jgi:class 3 adenylate cyclase
VLKLGLHAGPCIAVTTGDVLDYFGATVNIAARLEHQCHGGEVIVSEDAFRVVRRGAYSDTGARTFAAGDQLR